MGNQIKTFTRVAHGIIFIPFLATSWSFSLGPLFSIDSKTVERNLSNFGIEIQGEKIMEEDLNGKIREERARRIDQYFEDRSMPLAGTGMTFVLEAESKDIDWRLLPAIAIRESSGGKQMCGNNPFGWASCKVEFHTIEHGIETIAINLGGHNPRTADYYKDKDTREKLHSYNGTVIPTYVDEVTHIMQRIERGD